MLLLHMVLNRMNRLKGTEYLKTFFQTVLICSLGVPVLSMYFYFQNFLKRNTELQYILLYTTIVTFTQR